MGDRSGVVAGNIVQVLEGRVFMGEVRWEHGAIVEVRESGPEDPQRPYLIPGFVDAHVHVESSLLTPAEFGRMAVRHGTVAAVCDPHEVANVLGEEGVRCLLDDARKTPFKMFFGAPACVPATAFETAGATIGVTEIESLFQEPEVLFLSEVMNFPAVLGNDPDVLAKIEVAQRLGRPVDGHAPGLRGEAAARYAAAGIHTDHECLSLDEALDKLAAGLRILIREGSAARNFDTLHPLISSHTRQVMLCSDDCHPDDLLVGHIDRLAARAVAAGHDRLAVLRCACVNPVLHYDLPVGLLRVDDPMDAVEVADLRTFRPHRTWLRGRLAAEHGASLLKRVPATPINRFEAQPIKADDLAIVGEPALVRVIEVVDGDIVTRERRAAPKIEQGRVVPDPQRDILLLCVLNRYLDTAPAVALVSGFGLARGAIASSVAHDSHNVVAVGADLASLCRAVNAVVAGLGGIAVADGERVERLALPVAGLMSDAAGEEVAARYAALNAAARALGSPLRAPFMTLSFMALLVIPELKLSDLGLFDGRTFAFTDLAVQ